ncbi:hypothetical protein ACOMHN_039699 [Nucella lapillus]
MDTSVTQTMARAIYAPSPERVLTKQEELRQLQMACYDGDVNFVCNCLANRSPSDWVDLSTGQGPLHWAVQGQHVNLVKHVWRCYKDVDEMSNDGTTPLHLACLRGNREIVDLLLQAGARANIPNYKGRTALSAACRNGHLPIVQTLLQVPCIRVDTMDNEGWTPLHLACQRGDLPLVQMLLLHGADFNRLQRGRTPLYIAFHCQHHHVVKELLDHGAAFLCYTLTDSLYLTTKDPSVGVKTLGDGDRKAVADSCEGEE